MTGAQLLLVDGDVFHRCKARFRLTGCLYWEMQDPPAIAELYVNAPDLDTLDYRLVLDGREVKPASAERRVATVWLLDGGAHSLEFEHATMAIYRA